MYENLIARVHEAHPAEASLLARVCEALEAEIAAHMRLRALYDRDMRELEAMKKEIADLKEYERLYQDICEKHQDTYRIMDARVRELTARAEKAEAVNRWIPVSERQPKTEDALRGMIEVWDERDGPDTMSIDFYWEWETNVTHWRPLPKPPQEGE